VFTAASGRFYTRNPGWAAVSEPIPAGQNCELKININPIFALRINAKYQKMAQNLQKSAYLADKRMT